MTNKKREYSVEETIQAIIADFERRIRENITPPEQFTRDRVFNMLAYPAWGSWSTTWDEVNEWFDQHRPDIPTGREK